MREEGFFILNSEFWIFLKEIGQEKLVRELQKQLTGPSGKPDKSRFKGLDFFIAAMDPSFLDRLLPQVPANDVKELKAFCATATEETLLAIYEELTKEHSLWRDVKCSRDVKEHLLGLVKWAEEIDESRGTKKESRIFLFIAGGVRFFFAKQGNRFKTENRENLLKNLAEYIESVRTFVGNIQPGNHPYSLARRYIKNLMSLTPLCRARKFLSSH